MPSADRITPRQRTLGDRVRERRGALSLSQEGLALRAELDRTYVAQVESGRRNVSLDTLCLLATALGVDVGTLVSGLQDLPGGPRVRRRSD